MRRHRLLARVTADPEIGPPVSGSESYELFASFEDDMVVERRQSPAIPRGCGGDFGLGGH